MESVMAFFSAAGVVVSAASMVVAGLDKLAGITPTDKDDKALAAAARGLAFVSSVLDKFSVWDWRAGK